VIYVSVVYGIVAVLIFRRFTERAAIRRSVNRILAHVMELGLFLDSPGLVFGAQRDLLRENIRLLRLVMVPGLILAALFAPMYWLYGHGPLPVGEPSVVTIQMRDAAMPAVQLEAPEGMVVETPGVRILRDRQISWRVRALRQSSGDLKFHVENRVVAASFFLRDPAIQSIEIRYPQATILGWSWLLWFAGISGISALAFGLLR
jgi:hypothetical protein